MSKTFWQEYRAERSSPAFTTSIACTAPGLAGRRNPQQCGIDEFAGIKVKRTVSWTPHTGLPGSTRYAFQMKWLEGGKTIIRSLALESVPDVHSVTVLGHEGLVTFEQTWRGLAIDLPEPKPGDYIQCYRVSFEQD